MESLTEHLTLSPSAAVDLHMHTTNSDGRWSPAQLIDYLVEGGFDLVAITDHDRIDTIVGIQQLAAQKGLPVLAGVEMSTQWHGKMGHVLCYGFDPAQNELLPLAEQVRKQQLENTHEVNAELRRRGYDFPRQQELLASNQGELDRPRDNAYLLVEHKHAPDWSTAMRMISEAGFRSILAEMGATVEAAHKSGGVALIAHPGRREGSFTFYDTDLLDQVRAELPLDGIEIYHPYHSPEIIETYLAYVAKQHLLSSAGSDSHGIPSRLPNKHRPELSQQLLERLGIRIQ